MDGIRCFDLTGGNNSEDDLRLSLDLMNQDSII